LVPKPALLREGAVELLCRRIATLWSHAIVQAFSTTPAACEEHSSARLGDQCTMSGALQARVRTHGQDSRSSHTALKFSVVAVP
jgi:hypothetical protein